MCWTRILDFPVSRTVSDKCLQRKLPSLWYICYTAWTDWDTFDRGPFLTLPSSVLFTSLCTSVFYDLIPWHALESSTLFFIQHSPILPSRLSSDTLPTSSAWLLKTSTQPQVTWWSTRWLSHCVSFHEVAHRGGQGSEGESWGGGLLNLCGWALSQQ